MKFENFLGQSYQSAAVQVDSERTMNLYPEAIASDGGAPDQRMVLVRTPGLAPLQTLPDAPGRGSFSVNGRCFAVVGGSFFELLSPTTNVLRGTLPHGTSPVEMEDNSIQILLIADSLPYLFTLATNVFAPVLGQAGFPASAVSITAIDTYFLALGANSNQFSISGLLDGATWAGLNFGSSQEPDNSVALAASHGYLWIFGQNESVVFQDTGNNSFPFQRVPGSQIEMGCGAVHSVATLDNTLFWLGSSQRGPAVIYRADGFLPTRISHHALEYAMQSYPTTADATAYSYEENGHLFYRIDFPSARNGAGATWCYDVATKLWHERGYWELASGTYSAHRGRFHSFCFGKHLALDFTSGKVFEQSLQYADDAGNPIRWLRRAPHLADSQDWIFYSSFELLMQKGGVAVVPDFTLTAANWGNLHSSLAIELDTSPANGSYAAGCTVTIAPLNGFNGPVQLSIAPALPATALQALQNGYSGPIYGGGTVQSGLPAGVTAAFNPATLFGGSGSATLNLSGPTPASATNPYSNFYTFNIVATSGLLTHSIAVVLNVAQYLPG